MEQTNEYRQGYKAGYEARGRKHAEGYKPVEEALDQLRVSIETLVGLLTRRPVATPDPRAPLLQPTPVKIERHGG